MQNFDSKHLKRIKKLLNYEKTKVQRTHRLIKFAKINLACLGLWCARAAIKYLFSG
jgi:hypothetical protein